MTIRAQLEAWHRTKIARPWLGPLCTSRELVIAIAIMTLLAVMANVGVRFNQGELWKTNPEITEFDGALSFSTTDAAYFLGHAVGIKEGLSPVDYESKRSFPNNEKFYSQYEQEFSQAKRPLLARLISWLSPSASTKDLLNAAHTILLINAGITTVMIIVAFGATGYWLEGAVAAIGGGLSSAYLVRSSFGRIDTDQLNLGLMYLIFGLITLSARSNNTLATFFWAVAAGATAGIFIAWYGKAELILIALSAYCWLLVILKRNCKTTIICLSIFFLLSPVHLPNPFSSPYMQDVFSSGIFLFPNTFETITETTPTSISKILVHATGSLEMGLICLIGLGLWAIRHPVVAFAYSPLAAFALLNFVIGNRAIFFSAPIFWFGFAFLSSSSLRLILQSTIKNTNNYSLASAVQKASIGGIAGATIASFITWVNAPVDYLPYPSFPKQILLGFAKLKEIPKSEHSVVATWWDYGYASLFLNDLPTLHDGGSHTRPATHLFAHAMLKEDQSETVSILQFIVDQGNSGIQKHISKDSLFDGINEPNTTSQSDIYLVLTSQMAGWFGAISKIGNWNIETGKPILPPKNNGNSQLEYKRLSCNYRNFPTKIQCDGSKTISGWAWAQNGFAVKGHRYKANALSGIQTLQINNRLISHLLHRQLYNSSFNKLYHLGVIETQGITLFFDNYPHIRIYKIAGTD